MEASLESTRWPRRQVGYGRIVDDREIRELRNIRISMTLSQLKSWQCGPSLNQRYRKTVQRGSEYPNLHGVTLGRRKAYRFLASCLEFGCLPSGPWVEPKWRSFGKPARPEGEEAMPLATTLIVDGLSSRRKSEGGACLIAACRV